MFVFDPDYTFEWPVKVDHPGGEKQQFIGIFRQPDELEIFERIESKEFSVLIGAARDRVARLLVGWREIKTRDGGDFPFTEENRDRLLRNRDIRIAVDTALYEATVGDREKKLTRAAQALWGGVAVSDELVSDVMGEAGVDRDEAVRIARKMLGSDEQKIILPESERDTIRLALASAGQWRIAPFGLGGSRPVALDMTAVDVTARWLGIQPSLHIFDGLAVMEREALKIMRKSL